MKEYYNHSENEEELPIDVVTVEEIVDKRTDIQKYWNGDWYGMLQIYEATGSSYTWGNITSNIPDGMTATNGGIADRNYERIYA